MSIGALGLLFFNLFILIKALQTLFKWIIF